jgi:gliding motility-associated-like protein
VSINALPVATISGTANVCNAGTGTNITFTGTPNAVVSYTINGGATQTTPLNALGTALVPTGSLTANATYNLVSVSNPITTCSQAQTGTAVVTVLPLPTATIAAVLPSVCSGTGTNIRFTGTPNATVSYNINGGGTQTATLDTSGVVLVATGNLTVAVTYNLISVNNTTTTPNCSQLQSGSATININALPTASILGAATICSGTGTNIIINGTAGATVSYTINTTATTGLIPASGILTVPSGNLSVTTTYALTSITINNCLVSLTQSVVVTVTPQPVATIRYARASYCESELVQSVIQTGSTGGTYSANAPGLIINPTTGAITPFGSTLATYTVTYTIGASGGCPQYDTTTTVEIKAGPSAGIAYGNSYYCISDSSTVAVVQTGSTGGNYTASPVGLSINATTGAITPSTSKSGLYVVTYTIAAALGCPKYDTTTTVRIEDIPELDLPQDGFVCVDAQTNVVTSSYTININGLLPAETYIYQWYTISPSNVEANINLATQSSYEVMTYVAGQQYGVLVTDSKGCFVKIKAPVVKSAAPKTIETITSTYFAELQTVTVIATPAGDYEYQIDNGGYQDSNVFNNVGSGNHLVEVRDRKQCGVLPENVFIVDYPKYFTPNGDGIHDTWNISSLSTQPNAKIYIFDRLGKLVKQILPSGSGWNGTFNGQPLPATDYWFTIEYEEETVTKQYKAHFALKR